MMTCKSFVFFLTLFLSAALMGCLDKNVAPKILYVNSYHPGYPSSDEITEGIKAAVSHKNVDLEIVYMDTKKNQEEAFIREKAREIFNIIDESKPDVLIVSDDNAVAWLVVPYLASYPVPVVFCGVNWTAEPYGLPAGHITGMLEILPVEEGIIILKAQGLSIASMTILSENSPSEKKNITHISRILENAGIEVNYLLASDFNEWKNHFLEANGQADAIYMPTNGAIRDWDHAEAIRFIRESARVPLMTCDEFMMPYVMIGVTKVQYEQGEWAGKTALRILEGTDVSAIKLTQNTRIRTWWNPELGELINFMPGEKFLKEATRYAY
jgi:ABC-type uncharacterized transport system substrate-binding protein